MKDNELHAVRHLLTKVFCPSSAYLMHFRYISHMKFGPRFVLFFRILRFLGEKTGFLAPAIVERSILLVNSSILDNTSFLDVCL